MAKPRNGSSNGSNRSDTTATFHTRRSRRHAHTSWDADPAPATPSGPRQWLRGEQRGVRDQGGGTKDERRSPRPPEAGGHGQQQRTQKVTDVGSHVAGRQDGDEIVAGQVDESDLAG